MAMYQVSRVFNNGNKVPWVGFGTGTALYNKGAEEPVTLALSAGLAHIDTAVSYGNEDSVGLAIQKHLSSAPRDSVFVTTKLNTLKTGSTVRDDLVVSLKKLRLDYVDLYLIHTPRPHEGNLKAIWKQFEAVQMEGLAKNIGVSNFRIKDFEEFMGEAQIVPVCNQIEYNPYLFTASQPLLNYHRKHNIMTVSYGGLVPLSRKTGGPLDTLLPTTAERLSKDSGKDVNEGQVLTKWLLAKDVLPITTSSKKERLENVLQTLDLPDLTEAEISAIDEAGGKVHYRNYQKHMDL